MKIKVCYIVVYKPPHQKMASRHEEAEFEGTISLQEMLNAIRIKGLEFCKHHHYELERVSVKEIG